MRPTRFLDYDTPPAPPYPRPHSFYGIAAVVLAVMAMVDLTALQRSLIPESLEPLGAAAGGCAAAAAISACGAAALDQAAKQLFVWIGAACTASIPIVVIIASGVASRWIASFMPH